MVETTPQADQMIKESPADPVSLTTPVGVTKMPEPMMVPMIIPTPLKRVMLRFSTIFSPLAGESLVGLVAVGAGAMGVDGDAGCSTIRLSWSASASAAGGERTTEQETGQQSSTVDGQSFSVEMDLPKFSFNFVTDLL